MSFQLLCICLAIGATLAQDYQEYNRPAPSRLQQGGGGAGQSAVKPTPIPILKQINRHNEDGSYTYGYEGGDGSFKIETKQATGEVNGKYGYVDENGKVRVVEYGANKYGFQPSGEGITVAPPTLVDESTNKDGLQIDYDDEQQQQQNYQPIAPQKTHRPKPVRPQPPQQAQYHYEQQQQQQQQPQQQQQQYQPQFEREEQPQYVAPRLQQQKFANAEDVYASRPRPVRPESDYNQQQTFIPSPPQDAFESNIGRSFPQQQQEQQPAYTAPRAGSLFGPAPQQQRQQAPPQQSQQYSRPSAPAQSQGRAGGSVLDQLAKDFALPAGGSPALHDITYSYY